MMPRLRLVLGDQLSHDISSLTDAEIGADTILLAEVNEEATYVRHHKQKITLIFSAMRHFAAELEAAGHKVRYVRLDDGKNSGSLRGEVARALKDGAFEAVVVTEPGEYRLSEDFKGWSADLSCPVDIREDTRFLCSHKMFNGWAEGRAKLVMEFFYREMRKYTGLLMNGTKPEGGKWNYDAQNRKPFKTGVRALPPAAFKPDAMTQGVIALVERTFPDTFGDAEPFAYAVTRKDALKALKHFCQHSLPHFGTYQDAMATAEPYLFHSVLSPYINCGLLSPLEVCRAAEAEYAAGRVALHDVEGFVRQIIGWREFMRGVYWRLMPDYRGHNALNATRTLPWFYWSGDTQMNCLHQVVRMTQKTAYSHHIQRLMVTGNFALIAGLDVAQVHEWYLAVYADAYEWVELPNTLGMALYGDGGIVGTKPYAASGKYIDRMSNFCKTCVYDPQDLLGDKACPFNALYWNFLERNADILKDNPRMGFAYKNLANMPDAKRASVAAKAEDVFRRIENGEL